MIIITKYKLLFEQFYHLAKRNKPNHHFAGAIPLSRSFFGRGNTPILADYMRCSGSEAMLEDCTYNSLTPESTSYSFYSVVGVICQGNTTSGPECSEGDLHLVGGESENEGRVEICKDGFWGTVYDSSWDEQEAVVTCRQAGLPTVGKALL